MTITFGTFEIVLSVIVAILVLGILLAIKDMSS